jgi:hypothetical protein
MKITGLLTDFRKWLDGEDAATLAPEQPKARSHWEEFLVAVAREVEVVMQREMFTPPGGPTYIPREYLVFLSKEDDAMWQGDKREGLERGLHHVLSERARELTTDKNVQTKSFAVELRVDGTLEKGKFRVQPVWDSAAPKTEVKPRKKSEPAPAVVAPAAEKPAVPVTNDGDDATLSVAAPANVDSEATIVRPRTPLFSLRVSRGDGQPEVHKFYLPKITIGRGARDIQVDLKLEGDLEISRRQATLECLARDSFAITCEGRNPIEVDGREIQPGERCDFTVNQKLKLGSWQIEIVQAG